MKFKLTLLVVLGLFVFAQNAQAAIAKITVEQFQHQSAVKGLSPDLLKMDVDQFLTLTPSKYKAMTGKRLGLVNTLKLKAAQKMLKKELKRGGDISQGLYIVLAIFGLGFIGIGIMEDWRGSDWVINLLLSLLCWLPGLIHALIKMSSYYK